MSAARPTTSVIALSETALLTLTKRMIDVHERDLAHLVRRRWGLGRAQGWAVMLSFALAFGGVAAVGASVHSSWLLAAVGAGVVSLSVGAGFFLEAGLWRLFLRDARAFGLSESTSRLLYKKAGEAEAWLEVLRACGHEPTDAQIVGYLQPADGPLEEAA